MTTKTWTEARRTRFYEIKSKEDRALRHVFNRYKQNARQRGIQFSMTQAQVAALVTKPCTYCGGFYSFDFKKTTGESITVVQISGIDRADSRLPYVEQNTVSCCPTCNMMKNVLPVDQFLGHIRRIAEFNPPTADALLETPA